MLIKLCPVMVDIFDLSSTQKQELCKGTLKEYQTLKLVTKKIIMRISPFFKLFSCVEADILDNLFNTIIKVYRGLSKEHVRQVSTFKWFRQGMQSDGNNLHSNSIIIQSNLP